MKCIACSSITAAVIAAAAVIATGYFTSSSVADQATKVGPGVAAPDFQLKDQDGKTVSLNEFKDKVVVLEWFNDGCPFVQGHYNGGDMNRVADKYGEKQVVWLAINSTKSSNVEHNKKIAEQWKIERPILDDATGEVGHHYGARTTPHMYVINKGTIVYTGAIDSANSPDQADIAKSENYVAKALDEVLAGKPVSQAETEPYGCGVKYAK